MRARLAASQLLVFARRPITIWEGFAWYERGTPLRVIGQRPGQALVTWGDPDPAPVPPVWVDCGALSARSPHVIRQHRCRGAEVELPHRIAGRTMRLESDEGETPTLHELRGGGRSVAISVLSVGVSRRGGRAVGESEEAGLHARGRLTGARLEDPGPYGYGIASLCCPGWLSGPRSSDPRLRLARAAGLRASPDAEAWLVLRSGAEVVPVDGGTDADGASLGPGWHLGRLAVWLDLGEGSTLRLQGWIDASALAGASRSDPRAASRCVRP